MRARQSQREYGRPTLRSKRVRNARHSQKCYPTNRQKDDFLILGLSPAHLPEGGLNPEIASVARSFGRPFAVAIARGAHYSDPISAPLGILVPTTGTANSHRAAEIAVELARASRGAVAILFMSSVNSTSPVGS
jgi:hypothetical protein